MLISKNELNKIIQQIPSEGDYLPGLAIDCIVFGYHNRELKVLCTRQEGLSRWYLPSGHIKKDEGINEAAHRILKERTGVNNLFLKQFKTYGDEKRSATDSELLRQLSQFPPAILDKISWM